MAPIQVYPLATTVSAPCFVATAGWPAADEVPARPAAAAAASAKPDLPALRDQLQGATNSQSRPKKVVVLGWRGGVADLAVGRALASIASEARQSMLA